MMIIQDSANYYRRIQKQNGPCFKEPAVSIMPSNHPYISYRISREFLSEKSGKKPRFQT